MRRTLLASALAAAMLLPLSGHTKTLRWASQGDILTLDPHAQNEGLTIAASSYVYEPLVQYDQEFSLVPALATEWEQLKPTVWRFKLREGVKFHDGTDFTADDVVFSIDRALAPTSNFKAYVNGIKEARATGEHTVEIETDGPNPVLLRQLTNVFIMSRSWAEQNNATAPRTFRIMKKRFLRATPTALGHIGSNLVRSMYEPSTKKTRTGGARTKRSAM